MSDRPIKNTSNFIFASLLTGVYDVNRNEVLPKNDFSLIQNWYDSVLKLPLHGVIFHNSFSKELISKYAHERIQFVEVPYDHKLKPNVFRYFIYLDYLKKHIDQIKNLFVTDISDVEIIQNPFESPLFQENPTHLFCGDEPTILNNEWMRNHHSHLRNSMADFHVYETKNQHETLLNCGIIGGNSLVMQALLEKIVAMHEAFSYTNKTNYTLDMGVFNYVARTHFAPKIIHGEPVNTVFKNFETERDDCWFRHK